jgi:hypothetical protein
MLDTSREKASESGQLKAGIASPAEIQVLLSTSYVPV